MGSYGLIHLDGQVERDFLTLQHLIWGLADAKLEHGWFEGWDRTVAAAMVTG